MRKKRQFFPPRCPLVHREISFGREKKKPNLLCLVQSFFDFCSQGSLSESLHSLRLLAQKGLRLDTRALAFLIQKCAALESLPHAKWAHLFLKLTGLKHPKTFLSNQILHMYVKCGSFNEVRNLFEKMRVKNVFSWNAMLAGYTKLGMMNDSMSFFDRMPERDVVSWNTMIVGLAQNGISLVVDVPLNVLDKQEKPLKNYTQIYLVHPLNGLTFMAVAGFTKKIIMGISHLSSITWAD